MICGRRLNRICMGLEVGNWENLNFFVLIFGREEDGVEKANRGRFFVKILIIFMRNN